MLDGIDTELDPIGIVPDREVICGECKHHMIPLSPGRFRCPDCGMVFDDGGAN